jgi:hypothetical protein
MPNSNADALRAKGERMARKIERLQKRVEDGDPLAPILEQKITDLKKVVRRCALLAELDEIDSPSPGSVSIEVPPGVLKAKGG